MMNSNVLNASDVPQYLVEPILNLYKAGTSPQLISQSFGLDLNSVIAFLAGQQSESTNEFFESLLKKSQDFRCTITSKLMVDPVVASDGKLYDQDALKAYLKTSKVSPVTGERFQMSKLFQLNDLKQRIVEFCKTSLVKLNSILKLNTESEEPLKFAADCLSVLISNGQSLAEILEKLSALAPPKQKVLISMLGHLLSPSTQSTLLVELTPIISFRTSAIELFKNLLNQREEDELSDEEFSCLSALLTSEEVPVEVTELAFLASKFCDKTQLLELQELLKAVSTTKTFDFEELSFRRAELCLMDAEVEEAKGIIKELKKDERLRKRVIEFYDRVGWVQEKKLYCEEAFTAALTILAGNEVSSALIECLDNLLELTKCSAPQKNKRLRVKSKRKRAKKQDEESYPNTIYSYTFGSSQLHWLNMAEDSSQTVSIPNHVFPQLSSWVQLPSGSLFFTGGINPSSSKYESRCFEIDPEALTVENRPSMNVTRHSHGSLYIEGKVYAIGGYNDNDIVSQCEVYDCDEEVWTSIQSMPFSLYSFGITENVQKRSLLAFGGYSVEGDFNIYVQEYFIDSNTWETWPSQVHYPQSEVQCFKVSRESTDVYLIDSASLYKVDTATRQETLVKSGVACYFNSLQGPCYYFDEKVHLANNTSTVLSFPIGQLSD